MKQEALRTMISNGWILLFAVIGVLATIWGVFVYWSDHTNTGEQLSCIYHAEQAMSSFEYFTENGLNTVEQKGYAFETDQQTLKQQIDQCKQDHPAKTIYSN